MKKNHPDCELANPYPTQMVVSPFNRIYAIVLLVAATLAGYLGYSASAVAADCNQMEWRRDRPYDFYSAEVRKSTGTFKGGLLHLVEKYHFNDNVQSLKKGQSTYLPDDLIYILSTTPNHPRALDVYSTYEQRYQNSKNFQNARYTRKPRYTADCLFNRAVKVYPQHGETWMVWGIHLHRIGDYEGAVERYQRAISLNYNTAALHHNMGLSYFEVGQYDTADKHERIASGMGYPLKGLRSKLDQRVSVEVAENTEILQSSTADEKVDVIPENTDDE